MNDLSDIQRLESVANRSDSRKNREKREAIMVYSRSISESKQ